MKKTGVIFKNKIKLKNKLWMKKNLTQFFNKGNWKVIELLKIEQKIKTTQMVINKKVSPIKG